MASRIACAHGILLVLFIAPACAPGKDNFLFSGSEASYFLFII
jgi:hypothetical protein